MHTSSQVAEEMVVDAVFQELDTLTVLFAHFFDFFSP
jgi:hypothetical protein